MPTEIDEDGSLLYIQTMSKLIEISQLLAAPDGTYINGSVTGYLTQIRPPNGKGPSKAKLSDGVVEIQVTIWGGGVEHHEGKQVHFSGKGMKIQEYKGVKSLSVGDKVQISQVNSGSESPEDMPGDPVSRPVARAPLASQVGTAMRAPNPSQSAPIARNQPSSQPVNVPHGATVGASINKAVDIWISTNTEGHAWTESSATLVEKWARQLLAIHTAMERGEPPVNVPF